jgi:asparagine synthase (glutamine-hydrolysing)
LPAEILARGKHGFGVPFSQWFRGVLAPDLRAILDPGRLGRVGLFAPDAVARLVSEHGSGARNHAKLLWALVVFEQWRAHYLGDDRLV